MSKSNIGIHHIVLVLLGISVCSIECICNVCQANGAACLNATAYHLCYGSTRPYAEQVFTCALGMVCTDLPVICFQESKRPASCDDITSCGVCNDDLVFACTSRTTFAFCFGATYPSNVTGTCPRNKICDTSRQEICVGQLEPDFQICGLDAKV